MGVVVINLVSKLYFLFKTNVWLLAAFFIPLLIRCVPEVLSWPYPLGLDTLTVVPYIEAGVPLSSVAVFLNSHLFYSVAIVVNWLFGNVVVVLKVFGPILMGFVALMMYLYANRGLGWSSFKSFLVALLVGIYFVSLRNSWDLYAQSFGLIFLFAALIVLKQSWRSSRRYPLALVFMVLTVLSHQLVSVILFFVVGLDAVRYLVNNRRRDFVFSFACLGFAGVFFFVYKAHNV